MAYKINITADADRQFHALAAREQRVLEAAIASRLLHQPANTSKAIKQLRPNPFAEYELRVGDLRVLYNVEHDGNEVVILAIGRKVENKLIIESEEFHGHQDDLIEPTGDGSGKDSE